MSNCGFTKSGWLHSFITTNWWTVGNAAATWPTQAANAWICGRQPQPFGSVDGAHFAPPVNAIEWSG